MTKKERLQVLMESGDTINVSTSVCLMKGVVEAIDGDEITLVEKVSSTDKLAIVNYHYIQIDDIKVISKRGRCRKKKKRRSSDQSPS